MRHCRDLVGRDPRSWVKNLTVISNNAGVDGIAQPPAETRQIKKMISSYVGENKLFAQQYLAGELELEFNPQEPWPSASARRRRWHPGLLHQDRRRLIAEGGRK